MKRRARLALLVAGAAVGAAAVAFVAVAQPDDQSGGPSSGGPSASPPPPPAETAPPDQTPPELTRPPPHEPVGDTNSATINRIPAKPRLPVPVPPPPPPPPPPRPVRGTAAVLQALDKVTAQTMRFSVPVNKPIRYKNLVFIVKACETSGLDGPEPQSQAYVVIDFAPLPTPDVAEPPPKEVFKGWMFANSPSLNPFRHPIYDAWLIACTAQLPPA